MEQEKKRDLQLIIYARCNEIKELKKLIAQGAVVDIQDDYGNTALMCACYWGHTEIVKLLIEAGANLDIQDKYGRSALITASRNGYTEIVKLLIIANPHINGRYTIVI